MPPTNLPLASARKRRTSSHGFGRVQGTRFLRMDRAAIFQSGEPLAAYVAEALTALGVRLLPADLQKVAENAALLARHWQALTPALTPEAADGEE